MKDETLRELIQEKKQCLRTIEFEKSRLAGIDERAKNLLRELEEELESEDIGFSIDEGAKQKRSAAKLPKLPTGTWSAAFLGVILRDKIVHTSMDDMARRLDLNCAGRIYRTTLAGSMGNVPFLTVSQEVRGRFGVTAGWTLERLSEEAENLVRRRGMTFEKARQLIKEKYAAKDSANTDGSGFGGGVVVSNAPALEEARGVQGEGL